MGGSNPKTHTAPTLFVSSHSNQLMMRYKIFFISILCAVVLNTSGQSKSDTLNQLMRLSENYLKTMYESRLFDSASRQWSPEVISEARQFYSRKNIANLNDSLLMEMIKNAYQKYFQDLSSFVVGSMTMYTFQGKVDNVTEVRLLYYCTEKRKKKKTIRILLYFNSFNDGKTWNIKDSKTIDITSEFI